VAWRRTLFFGQRSAAQDDTVPAVSVAVKSRMRMEMAVGVWSVVWAASGVLATQVAIWKPW
jgi:hypothetical protein